MVDKLARGRTQSYTQRPTNNLAYKYKFKQGSFLRVSWKVVRQLLHWVTVFVANFVTEKYPPHLARKK